MRTVHTNSFRVSIEGCPPDMLRDHFKIQFVCDKCQNCASFAANVNCLLKSALNVDLTSEHRSVKYM